MSHTQRLVDLFSLPSSLDFVTPDPTDATPGVVFGSRSAWTGEHHLWAAVLWDAALILRERDTTDPTYTDAWAWVTARYVEIGGYAWVCDLLGLDVEAAASRMLARRVVPRTQFGSIRSPQHGYKTLHRVVSHAEPAPSRGSAYQPRTVLPASRTEDA